MMSDLVVMKLIACCVWCVFLGGQAFFSLFFSSVRCVSNHIYHIIFQFFFSVCGTWSYRSRTCTFVNGGFSVL